MTLIETITDVTTNEVTEVQYEMSKADKALAAEHNKLNAEYEAELAAKEAARAAILEKLGLSAEEAKLLLQ